MKKIGVKEFLNLSVWPIGMLYLIIFIMPLNKRVIPGLIFFLFLFSLLQFRFKFYKVLWPLIFLIGIYALHAIGLLQSEHLYHGKKELEYKASLLAFPLIALMLPYFSRQRLLAMLWLFCSGTILFMFIAIGYGIYRSIHFDDAEYLSYGKLGIIFHPTYAAIYQVFALSFLLLRGAADNLIFRSKIFHYAICVLMVVFVSMLASKAGILSVMLAVLFCGIIEWKVFDKLKSALILSLLLVGISVMSALYLPKSGQRIEGALKAVEQNNVGQEAHTSVDLREVAWSASVQLILDNPWGVGTGNTTPELVKKYEEMGEMYAVKKNLNSHNQFLQTTCELGWPGLLLLCLCLGAMFRWALKSRDWLFMLFTGICAFNFLFESFLEVQAGLVFFSLWTMVFLKREGHPDWEK